MSGRKKAIPKRVKALCWAKWIGNSNGQAPCYCCGSATVSMLDFHAGHVQSEAHGGAITEDNLRPICAQCNTSMGKMNMREFSIKHFPGKGKISSESATITLGSQQTVVVAPAQDLKVASKEKKTKRNEKKACKDCGQEFTLLTLSKYDGLRCKRCHVVHLGTQRVDTVHASPATPFVDFSGKIRTLNGPTLDWVFSLASISPQAKMNALVTSASDFGHSPKIPVVIANSLSMDELVTRAKARDLIHSGLNKHQLELLLQNELSKLFA